MNEIANVTSIKGEACKVHLADKALYLNRNAESLRAIVFFSEPGQKHKITNPVIVVWADDVMMKIECKTQQLFPEKIKTWDRVSKLIPRKADFVETALINSGLTFSQFMKRVN